MFQLIPTASLWTLMNHPSAAAEWSLESKLAAVKDAGFRAFQGVAEDRFKALAADYELAFLATANANAADFPDRLREAAAAGARRINVLFCRHDTPLDEAARAWIELDRMASDLGLAADLETHRGTCTDTPEKTWRIAEVFEQTTGRPIRLNFDLSHFAVFKHFEPHEAEVFLTARPDLIRHSRQVHLRPFSGQHAQIPVSAGDSDARHPAYVAWLELARAFLACWLAGRADDACLHACPELGGVGSGYWLPGFPPPWPDAIRVKRDVQQLWSELV
jgi:hypothetical protein